MKYANIQYQGTNYFVPFSEILSRYNYLFVTKNGDCLKLAETIRDEGSNVKVHFLGKPNYTAKFDLVGQWENWKGWADVIVIDDPTLKEKITTLKKNGYFCIDYSTSSEIFNTSGKLSEKIYKWLEGDVFGTKK